MKTYLQFLFSKGIPFDTNNSSFYFLSSIVKIKKLTSGFLILLCLTGIVNYSSGQILWSSAGGSAWLTGSNWTGGVTPNGTQIGQFGVNPTAATGVGINGNGATNNGTGNQAVGGVEVTSARAAAFLIGNSSTTAGANLTFTLNGATINGVANTILRNNSSQTFTLQNTQNVGTQLMTVAPNNATDNIINVDGTGNIVISSNITGTSKHITLNNASSGDLRLSGTNSFTGGITVNSSSTGRLRIDATAALPTTGTVRINTAGVMRFNVAGTYGGSSQALEFNPNQTTTPSLDINISGNATWQGTVNLMADTRIEPSGASNSITFSGNATGAGTLIKQAAGTLILSGTSNALTGGTQIGNGALTVNSGSSMGTGALTLAQTGTNATTINLNNTAQTVSSLSSTWTATSGTIAQTINIASGHTLTIDQSANTTFGAGAVATLKSIIAGAGNVVKTGIGNLTLTSDNTYTGTTSINGGALTVNGSLASGSAVTVGASGTLAGTGAANGTVSLSGIVSPGNSPGTLNTGAFTFNANSTYKFEISNATGVAGTDWDKLVSSGVIDVSASPITIDLTSIGISNFNNATPFTWLIASGSSITGFNAANFTISTTNFTPALAGGTFSVTQTGNDINLVFTPGASVPTLTSPTAVAITNSSADLGATITLDGGSAITARGTVYKTSPGVTSTDNPLAEGGTSTGTFSHTRSALNPETQYFYTGYATNGSGTALSPESNFRTLSNPPTSEATGFSATAFSSSQIDLNWTVATFPGAGATANGYIILRRQDSTNPSTSGIVNATAPGSLSFPSGTTLVTTLISGSTNTYSNTGLTSSTQYNYLIVPFTWDGTNTNTYNYYLTNAPAVNATTQAGLPVVTSPTVTNVSSTSAVLGANVTADGGSALTARGTVYKTSTGVVITDNPLAEGGTSTGVFSHTRSSLDPETQYFFKGYATNANGSGLSSESSFYTFSASPSSEVTGFSGTPVSTLQINLSWTAATFPGAGATATGYAIVRRSDSTNPSTTGIVNGTDPASLSLPGGTLLTATITSGATTSFNNTGLNANAQYNYLIVPYTWDGLHTATYNYYLTNAATTNATTLPAVPSLNNPTATGITENSAVLGATITSDNGGAISERGTVYKTSSPVTATDNPLAEGGLAVGTFSHTRSPFSPETQYFYAGYATNAGGTGLSNEGNFRTLSNPPTSEVTNFIATAFSPTQIDLGWTIATFPGMGATANGYIILRKIGTNPATTGIVNATSPGGLSLPVGTTLVTTINSGATNSYSNTGLTAGNQYNYLIIPFTWDGMNAATYNYYLINGATANATTPLLKQTFASDGSAFSASKWSVASGTSCDLTNLTNAFASGSIANFCTAAGTGTGASIQVAGITATESFTLTSVSGTITNLSNGIVPIDVASGKTLDFSTQSFTSSVTAGYIKNGTGAVALAGNTYGGGFTLNAGTIVARGTNAMGGNVSTPGPLTLNGGTVAANAARDFTGKYSVITFGGDVQFGSTTLPAVGSSNLTFSNNVSLGNANRTLTLGGSGAMAFSGVISNTGSNGITFSANTNGTGRFDITNIANTFTGPININGDGGTGVAEVRFTADGSLGNTSNTININGGRLSTLSGATYTLTSTRGIQVGNTAGTSISAPGAGTLTYNGIITDLAGSTPGSWAKQGGGTLSLGGVSSYTGSTSFSNGIVILTTGNDRLPTGTTLNVGQAASANLGTFNLNGFNQQVAGLNSVTGTNATANNNTITSTAAATLTLSGSGTYAYGDGTNTNSGVITGAISIVKSGAGTQTLGDANTYTGTTSINDGTLIVNGSIASGSAVTVGASGTLAGTGSANGTVSLSGTISPGSSPGTITTGAFTFNANSTYKFEISNATGVAGTDWDKLVSTGIIDVTTSPINIDLTSISITNFNNASSFTWLFASGSSITGFNAANFTISTTNFTPALAGGTFSVTQTGNDLNLVFTPLATPIIINPTSASITNNTAVLGAEITSDGGSAITARGTVYKTTPGVTSTDNPLAEGGTSIGVFSHTRSSLNPETQYFYAGYATNAAGTALSPESNFRTLSNPPTSEATAFNATAVSSTQIDLGWTVASFPMSGATANGYIILRRQDATDPSTTGIVNATAPGSLSLPSGTTLVTTISSGSTNNYSNTSLVASTQYNYRIVPFTWDGTNATTYNYYLTNAPAANATTQSGLPVVISPTVANITSGAADLGANVTSDGGNTLTARGTVYKTTTGVTITDNPLAEGGLTTGVFSHTRSALNPETQYFFKGYATNANGSGLSSESSFYTYSSAPTSEVTGFTGTPVSTSQINLSWTAATFPGTGASATGYVILRRSDSTNPSTTGFINGTDPASLTLPGGTVLATTVISGATTSFNNTGLANANTQYNYLIVPFTWDGVNAATYNYYLINAATTNATTLPGVPSLNNPTATGITESSAVLGATVTSDNGGALTARGTVYLTSSPVTATDNPLAEGGTAVGTFTHTRSSLAPQTQYFYAGYATNAGGTGLSSEGNFRTLSNPPTSAATNFIATPFSSTQIDLSWTVATFPGSGATSTGYIILRKNGTNPATTGILNATAPASLTLPGGTTLVTNITSGATSNYSNTGLTAGTQYNYLIIPYTWDGTNATTYNYYLPNGATANATTPFPKQTFASDASAFSASKWSAPSSTSCDLVNQTNAFTNGSVAYFCTPAGTGTGASITVAGITATENFTLTAASGTISNQANGIIPIDVAPGKTLDLSTQNLSGSATGGYIKNNTGILATAGNTYAGGFTLNAGTVIVRGINAMGSGGSNTLTLNGGILASNANRDLSGKYPGGITIGGDVQFGDVGGLAGNFSLTFSNNISLGNLTRTFTKGHTSNIIFSGVISGTNGITYAANANATSGVFTISNIANTYTGTTSITGGEVEFLGGDGAFGAVPGALTPNSIIIDGGRLTVNTAVTTTLNANRGIQIGASANTGISVKTGVTVLVYNGVIADKPSTTGSWAKQGGNVIQLGGVSTYTGSTSINNGTLQLITGSNRLPTGTTLNLGQAASTNLGTFNMNGFSQQVAGLNSTPGSNATANNNTVTSSTAATLTLGGNGTYNYGDGTNGNSGVITGAILLVKSGTGTQTLGDANTYTGNTTINSGELRYTPSVNTSLAGSLILNGGILGTSGITATRTLTFSSFDLSDNSNIDLSPVSDHTITFTVAGTFTSGKTLTIYGWQGIGGASGTKGKIFYSNSATGLTAGQLAQIQFNNGTIAGPGTNYPAVILSTGEVVSSTTIGANTPPTIVINVAATTDYIDGGVGTSPSSPYAVSGVISDPTDPFNTLGIDFTINDIETIASSLVVTASSSMTSVVPNANINLTGSGASRNVKITPSTVGYTNITVTVSDGVNSTSYIINYAASAASVNTSTTRFLTGTSDASTAQGVGTDYMLVGDDENQALRLYNRFNSGLPVNGFDYSVSLGITPTNPEVDIEGSVEVGNRIYWLGSHSNSANAGNLRPNRYRLFATDVTGSGANATLSYIGRYDGLRTDLLAWDAGNGHGLGADYFGLVASAAAGVIPEIADGSGFNIEGLTIAPDNSTAYICFRAPISPASNRINGLIIPVTNLTALVTGNPSAGPATFGAPIMLDLGGRGIREIMRNASGQYIIMAGPHDGSNNFKLYTWTGNAADAPEARSADLTALMTGGSIESIVNVPDPLLSTSVIQVLVDNGDTQYYNDGINAKDLPNPNHKKFRSEIITLGCRATRTPTVNGPLCAGLQSVSGTSNEADGTVIEVFVNGSSVGTTTVSAGTWTKTGVNLGGSNLVKATATASGECVSLYSNTVTVTPPVVMNTNNSGAGSMRDIIGCVGPGATITFDGSLVNSTITLTTGEILIDKDLTIMGPGLMTDITLSGNNASRIFTIAAGKTVTLQNLSLKNANAASPDGGALLVNGIVNLENILLQNNFEDGINPRGITIKGPAGAINVIGTNVQIKP